MATDYVEDYEEVTGLTREKFKPETKVVTPPAVDSPVTATAETK